MSQPGLVAEAVIAALPVTLRHVIVIWLLECVQRHKQTCTALHHNWLLCKQCRAAVWWCLLLLLQVETASCYESMDEVLSVPGITSAFLGDYKALTAVSSGVVVNTLSQIERPLSLYLLLWLRITMLASCQHQTTSVGCAVVYVFWLAGHAHCYKQESTGICGTCTAVG